MHMHAHTIFETRMTAMYPPIYGQLSSCCNGMSRDPLMLTQEPVPFSISGSGNPSAL